MTEHGPDRLGLPFALWGREAGRDLVRTRFGVMLAIRPGGDYLRRWGFTPQRGQVIAWGARASDPAGE